MISKNTVSRIPKAVGLFMLRTNSVIIDIMLRRFGDKGTTSLWRSKSRLAFVGKIDSLCSRN